ncbi:hypothetical protein E4U21_003590 [Claviceps maximensis]|nr:hypothetical protein E4U21_003590 [Claviceps maximensis]
MVKITTILMAALAAIAPVAEAGDCVPGLLYCGDTLLRYDDYKASIIKALGFEPGPRSSIIAKSLFNCRDPSGKDLLYSGTCPNICREGGDGHGDYCSLW